MDNNTLPHVLSELFRDIDNEDDIHAIIAEYQRAMDIADQYKMNSDRIKTLLSYDPVSDSSGRFINSSNKDILLVDALFDAINPVLL